MRLIRATGDVGISDHIMQRVAHYMRLREGNGFPSWAPPLALGPCRQRAPQYFYLSALGVYPHGTQERIRREEFRQALSSVLRTWRSPNALADFYIMHQRDRGVRTKQELHAYVVLGASGGGFVSWCEFRVALPV